MEQETNGMEGETDGMEEKTNGMEGKTDRERLTIVGVEYVMETTFAILNTSSSNRIVAMRRSLQRIPDSNGFATPLIHYI